MDHDQLVINLTCALEAGAIVAILVGLVRACGIALRLVLQGHPRQAYRSLRNVFGQGLLFGLEVLVAADIIRTVTVDVSLDSLLGLALLVLVRTFLSWSLDVDIEGHWPWKRTQVELAASECEDAAAEAGDHSS